MTKECETFVFKKGEILALDQIYIIQGLGGGDWWTADDPANGGTFGEVVTITRNIKITVIIEE